MTEKAESSVQREAPMDETNEGLVKRVDAVDQEIGALSAALARARSTRLGIFLGFLIVAGGGTYAFYQLAEKFRSEENINKLGELAQQHLDENKDRYIGEVRTLVDQATPVLTKAFFEQAKQDTPKYTAALEQQREALLTNLATRLEEQITTHYQAILSRHRGIIKEQFPDLTDEQLGRVALNLEKAAKQLVEKYYVDQMSAELDAMYQAWDRFPVADPPGPNDLPLEDQLVGYLLEIVTMKLTSTEPSSIIETEPL